MARRAWTWIWVVCAVVADLLDKFATLIEGATTQGLVFNSDTEALSEKFGELDTERSQDRMKRTALIVGR